MANKKRIIVMLTTLSGETYEIDSEYNGHQVKSIVFNQNGLTSINQGAGLAYVVTLQDPIAGKIKLFKVIPYNSVQDISFVDIEDPSDVADETAKDMKKVQ